MTNPVYVTQLSKEKQKEIANIIKERLKLEGYTEIQIHDAIANAMDSKIADIQHVISDLMVE